MEDFKTRILNTDLSKRYREIVLYLTVDLWRIQTQTLPPFKAGMIRYLRTAILSFRRFSKDDCQLHASALTFFSLISIVPVLAMTFGIAQGFGFEKMLENLLYERFPGQEKILAQGIEFANNLLQRTRGGALASIGLVGLIWSVVKVLGNIEASFNDIWDIRKSRPMLRKITDYLSIILICPMLFILSNSLALLIKTEIDMVIHKFSMLGVFSPFFSVGFKLVPLILMWTLFTSIYMFMTNTKVNFKSALLAGILAGTVFQFFQWGLIAFQVGVGRYNAIYGSFSAIPLFLIWLQVSWLILLAGAEVAFAHQHIHEYELEPDTRHISRELQDKLALFITHFISKKFISGETPLNENNIASQTGIPIQLTRRILAQLVSGGILSETFNDHNNAKVYQPARDIHQFSIKFVLDAITHFGSDTIPLPDSETFQSISRLVDNLNDILSTSEANQKLTDI